jgi:hypothetical protein
MKFSRLWEKSSQPTVQLARATVRLAAMKQLKVNVNNLLDIC